MLPLFLIIPVVAILVAVILIPEILSLYISLQNYTFGYPPTFVGLSNYLEILHDPVFLNAILLNIVFVFIEVSVEFLLGLGSALLLSRKFPLQRVWVSLIIAPFAISPVVSVVAWKNMLSADFGVITYILSFFGISTERWLLEPLSALLVIVIINAWREFPFTTLILYSAIITIPVDRIEAALVDGASKFQRFRYITLPSIRTATIVALTFRTIFAFRTFDVIWILTQGGPFNSTTILSIYLYIQSFRYLRLGMGAAIGMVMLIFTLLVSAYYMRGLYKQIMERS